MPTLEIRENAIDLLMSVYKATLPQLDGHLCEGGRPVLARVEAFIQAVGVHEDAIFAKRARQLQRQLERHKRDKQARSCSPPPLRSCCCRSALLRLPLSPISFPFGPLSCCVPIACRRGARRRGAPPRAAATRRRRGCRTARSCSR